MVLRVGKLTRDDWILVCTPLFYYFLIPLQGKTQDANVDLLWSLTFQWTTPAAIFGFVVGSYLKRTQKPPKDDIDIDE